MKILRIHVIPTVIGIAETIGKISSAQSQSSPIIDSEPRTNMNSENKLIVNLYFNNFETYKGKIISYLTLN